MVDRSPRDTDGNESSQGCRGSSRLPGGCVTRLSPSPLTPTPLSVPRAVSPAALIPTMWVLRLGVPVLHGCSRHPLTQGEQQRFPPARTNHPTTCFPATWLPIRPHRQRAFHQWHAVNTCQCPTPPVTSRCPPAAIAPLPRALPRSASPVAYAANTRVRPVRDGGTCCGTGTTPEWAKPLTATLDETTKTAKID